MNILCIGDIFGEPGRRAVETWLSRLIDQHGIDFVIANVDNAAGGKGITDKVAEELFQYRIDVMTAGNHVWEQNSIFPHLETHPILRPYNLLEKNRGKGHCIVPSKKGLDVAVIHLQGKVFMDNKGPKMSSPFQAADALLKEIGNQTKIILVDLHAEATAEKRALAWYLDGRVTCVVGTHTHVQTCDEEILPRGTAYISDLGMTGPHRSVVGLDIEIAIKRFLSQGEFKGFKVAKEDVRLEGLLIDVDEESGRAISVNRIRKVL
ncbi:MAG: metallophosphoesterase [Deltaproteobacteria bacterium RIFCSPLOWO2_01_44_7]|nr:MAG: metallophosphoesterase [Deltaproteobacteria bacterium RIFCSPHIGHO2_01_FULL_43_49]OGQ15641.1 MAG: metallophosphoesterase [Deltaproteobacteria bacterium RIFCSPHIGHO2_02_FULL_44_53]OGQ28610.1 MAG: metallophosphoesterase [Deltaproteobacteria bacterium RIFCSPHIGHO2_12_FULL_44_21]OGQ31932.1 MAG: metallophosphoesterase [Deltaproteobacteria bacterium RIFCSPLOWO2_01_FULL_45_74]OGQ38474.1 MAG: metallophosphoesterase [Deltaproteobacteria bacterium RIFCSPLOWO2_01_44_7]OGQ43548.1 MAG: metallophosph